MGPTLSFRGIDNASYYWLEADNTRFYDDFTGCGSSVTSPPARSADGDGFAALLGRGLPCRWLPVRSRHTLARGPNGFRPRQWIPDRDPADPVLSSVKAGR